MPSSTGLLIRQEQGYVKTELRSDLAARTPITGVPPNVCSQICVVTRRIIEQLFDPTLTVEAVLDRCGVASHTFTAYFRRVHDRTPGRYIWHGRMCAARRCLRHPELEITTIAFSVGYTRYRTFARAVKRYADCSPSVWREELLGENVQ